MYIDSAAIITIASVLGALTAIGAVAYKIIKWFQAQEKQTTDIEDLKNPDYYSNCLVLLESQGRKHYQNQKGIPRGNKGYFC